MEESQSYKWVLKPYNFASRTIGASPFWMFPIIIENMTFSMPQYLYNQPDWDRLENLMECWRKVEYESITIINWCQRHFNNKQTDCFLETFSGEMKKKTCVSTWMHLGLITTQPITRYGICSGSIIWCGICNACNFAGANTSHANFSEKIIRYLYFLYQFSRHLYQPCN